MTKYYAVVRYPDGNTREIGEYSMEDLQRSLSDMGSQGILDPACRVETYAEDTVTGQRLNMMQGW